MIPSTFIAVHVGRGRQKHLDEKADRLEPVAYRPDGLWPVGDIAMDDGFEVLRLTSGHFEHGIGRRADSKSVSPIILDVVAELGISELWEKR